MRNYEYVQEHYKVPAEYGREIKFEGRRGIIVEDRGNYIGVNFDDEKPGIVHSLHPTYNIEYLGIGSPKKLTKSQLRYREYLRSEYGGSFAEWLGIN